MRRSRVGQTVRADYAIESEIAAAQGVELAASMMLRARPSSISRLARSRERALRHRRKETDFGRQLLLARVAENGVRFIRSVALAAASGASCPFRQKTRGRSAAVDKPVSDWSRFETRGMLDSTLVVFTSEFGRTPWSQNTTGRDHNAMGFSTLLAGGGVKGGVIEGATDEVGYRAVENPHYISDLQSTILQQVGLDHKKMDFVLNGRPFHLVEEGLGPINAILR